MMSASSTTCFERAIGYTVEGQLLGHIVMELETVSKSHGRHRGFSRQLKNRCPAHAHQPSRPYEFGSPKLPMIREALAFHYMDDLDSKLAACPRRPRPRHRRTRMVRLQRRPRSQILRLDQFLKSTTAKAEENLPNPKLFQ